MGKMLDSTLSWIFEKMAKAYVHRTGSNLPDAKVPVVQDVDGKPYFNLSSIGSADLAKLSGANGIDGTIAEAISGLRNTAIGTFRANLVANQNVFLNDTNITGVLPPNSYTFFVPISQQSTLNYIVNIGFDEGRLFAYSTVSQEVTFYWLSIS